MFSEFNDESTFVFSGYALKSIDIVFEVFVRGDVKVKLFCFVDNAKLIPKTDKPDVLISPTTFNDELIVVAY